VPGKTAVIMTLEGTEPTWPSVILNSHIDVVPVFEVRGRPNEMPSRTIGDNFRKLSKTVAAWD